LRLREFQRSIQDRHFRIRRLIHWNKRLSNRKCEKRKPKGQSIFRSRRREEADRVRVRGIRLLTSAATVCKQSSGVTCPADASSPGKATHERGSNNVWPCGVKSPAPRRLHQW